MSPKTKGKNAIKRVEWKVQAEKAKLECETMCMQHQMDMMRYKAAALAKRKDEGDSDEDKCEKLQYDKIVVNMPRSSDVKTIVDGVSGDDWTKFGVGIVAYASQRDENLGEMYDKVMENPDTDV